MRLYHRAGLLCLFLLLVACGAAGIYILRLPQRALGAQTLDVIAQANRAETFRLRSDVKDAERKQISDFPLAYKSKPQGQAFVRQLDDVLRNPKTYWGFNDTTCLIDPGAAFRLWSGKQCVEVIICFHCDQMLITTKNAQGQIVHVAYTEIGSVRSEFVRIAKQAFPEDADIQELKSH